MRENFANVLVRIAPDRLTEIDRKAFFFILDVLIRAALKEKIDDFHVTAHRRPVQRRVITVSYTHLTLPTN